MLRMLSPGRTLWDSLLPTVALVMPSDLEFVDRVLDDPGLLEPFRSFFSPLWGRPSTPMETFVRLMFLKSWLKVGYEELFERVSRSVTFLVFCRIGLGADTPAPLTMAKLVRRFGPDTVAELNRLVLLRAHDAGLVDVSQVRVDSTVVPADIEYPTDSGLLAKGIRQVLGPVERIRRVGIAGDVMVDDCRGEVRRLTKALQRAARGRTDEARDDVLVVVDELADLAEQALEQARQVAEAGEAAVSLGFRAQRLAANVGRLAKRIPALEAVVVQSRQVARHRPPAPADRRVSLHDGDARPIRKSTSTRNRCFGYTGQVMDNRDGLILDYDLAVNNPPDGPRAVAALGRVQNLFGRLPGIVTADRGYGDKASVETVSDLGVGCVAILRKGNPGAERRAFEQSDRVQSLVKWRSGSEGRISAVKREWGWNRARLAGIDGAATWCGWGIYAHNCDKIGQLIAKIET